MPLTPRFTAVDKAILTATGNSFIMCGSTSATSINTSSMITPNGDATRDWEESGSSARLNILNNSTILYAELLWYSTVKSNIAGSVDLRSVEDSEIEFITPKQTYYISPQAGESYTGESGSIDRFRRADVTNIIKDSLSGTYTVAKVPISVPESGLSNTRAGWTLVVVYRNDLFVPQKIGYTSGIMPATASTPFQSTITGFTTESNEAYLKGSIFLACANGEPLAGEQMVKAGPSFASLVNMGNIIGTPNPNPGTTPNNPYNSFFTGQNNICDPLNSNMGLIDVNGTNGSENHDGFVPTQVLNGRNKWDITSVNLQNALIPNQTILAGQLTANGTIDGVQLLAIGTQICSQAPDIIATLEVYDVDGDNEYNVEVGEQLIYSVRIKNDGSSSANNVTLSMNTGANTSFIPNSIKINDVVQIGANINNGINIGSIPPKGVTNVLFAVRVNSLPEPEHIIKSKVNYNYEFTSGQDNIINYAATNEISVIVQDGHLNIQKSASKNNASIEDIVTYTIDISNTGSELAKNMFFQDIINSYCSFVTGSVKIDGVSKPSLNPKNGFNLPDLNVNSSTQITFDVKIDFLPPSTIVNNIASISFGYTFNQYEYLREKTVFSNDAPIQIEYVDVIGERCNNNNYPEVGDIVTYTLSLTNIGNIPATDVQVLEPVILGSTFVDGSVKINGQIKPTLNPFTGFILENPINSKQTTTVDYNVLVNEVKPNDAIENTAQIPFKYQITTQDPVISDEENSNTVETIANFVCMSINETVDKAYAAVGEELYYTVQIANNGNINAYNTLFSSSIQSDTTFVPNSVTINGVNYPGYNPNQGFSIGTICPGNTIEVTFKAIVNNVPNPNIVHNQSELIYSYLPNPDGNSITDTIISNKVQTIINEGKYSITKTVDKAYAQLGDFLVYTTTITNTGTVDLTNASFADYIAEYLLFYANSVYINGINYPDYNPTESFSVGNIHPGDTISISFAAIIDKIPPYRTIFNMSESTFSYKVNPESPIITKTVYSNEVQTRVAMGDLSITKVVDKSYATIGDVLTYSFSITNTGNTPNYNVVFTDIIPQAASFVEGSVFVNGVNKSDYNPNTGFNVGTINVGQVVNVKFNAKVDTLPIPNTIINSALVSFEYYVNQSDQPVTKNKTSNSVTTIINEYSANLVKSVDKAYAVIGDILNYTVIAYNTGTVSLSSVNFKDMIPSGATFVEDSVMIDGVNKPGYNPNTGFLINNVLPEGNVVVMFKATITSIPTPPQINNTAEINFKYRLSPTSPEITDTKTSNTVTTNISTVSVTNVKSVDKTYATIGDTLTYTSVITNTGNINITDTNFIDTIPTNTSFVANSVKINDVSYPDYNPSLGFTIGTVPPNTPFTITFQVKVDTLPNIGYITNASIIYYQYKINPNEPSILANTTSNIVTTYINLGNLTITKTADRNYAILNDVIRYSFVITNTGNTILKNLYFKDIIQIESLFDTGSVYINEINKPTYNPNTGFNLEDISIGGYATIHFTVSVKDIPADGKLYNTGDITFSYYVNPQETPITKTLTSNTTTVNISDAIVSATKSVDKSIAKIGDTLNFTVNIDNKGNVEAQNVYFKDILDSNILFTPGSVYINDILYSEYNPNTGFDLSNINPSTITTVKFSATIITRPIDNIVENFATIDYEYIVGEQTKEVSITTNTTETYVATGELTLTKSTNKLYATVGDNIGYTVLVKNTGSVNATNLSFKDIIDSFASFNLESVVVNGVSQPTFNPNTGFNLSNLAPNEFHTITFTVKVSSLPPIGKIENTADTTFTYILTPSDEPITTTAYSNTVTTYINLGKLTLTKAVDKMYATIGDVLNYTITINNIGNATCSNIFFSDAIQNNASFVNGSVKINGVAKPTFNPNTGFNLEDILGNTSATITFAVTVETLPVNYIIYNSALANYKYYINPSDQPVSVESSSNTVTTAINIGKLDVTKSVNKSYATIGDTLTYTVNILNSGNVDATNINFRDVIPNGLTFVANSVTINGISYPSYDPYQSFSLGNIISGDTVIVKFNATVTSLPNPSLISNTANITFTYRINPQGPDVVKEINSNTVTTQINVGSINLTKSVDKRYVVSGEVITYTIVLNNTGNIDVQNVVFVDNLQSDISFNTGSVEVNDVPQPTFDPTQGFSLGNIPTLGSVKVVFKVTVSNNPTHETILNFATGTYSYKIDPNGIEYSKSTQSNTVNTFIVMPKLTATETVDLAYATLQDTLSYKVTLKNEGNTAISQLFFNDTISNGAIFTPGTVIIDGVSFPTYDPITGFNLPTELIAGNTTVIEFKAKVTALPTPPQVNSYATAAGVYKVDPQGPNFPIDATSNTVTTNINVGSLSNVKSVDKMYAKVSDTLTYTSIITNTGNVNANNIHFYDTLQQELSFVLGSVTINGVNYPSYNPTIGFSLGNLAPTQSITVIFEAKINALPTPPQIDNKSQSDFSYKIDPNGSSITKTVFSNTVTTQIVKGELNVTKSVNKPIATIGDTLTYTINLTNTGNIIAKDVYFQDTPSTGVTFKAGTVKINGVVNPAFDPTIGFTLGDIGIGDVVVVEFTVDVVSVPPTNKVTNQAVINFKYIVDPKQPPVSQTTYSNTVTTNIALGSLSVTKAVDKKFATIGEHLTYTVTIVNTGNIDVNNVVFLDPTPNNVVFAIGSVMINGLNYPNYNPSAGFELNTMVPGQIITVVYQVIVTDLCQP